MKCELWHNLCTLPKEFDHMESTLLQNILFLLHVDEEVPVQAVYNVRI